MNLLSHLLPDRTCFCPAEEKPRAKFTIIDEIDAGLKHRYENFLAQNDIEIAGIEFIADTAGNIYTYDVNTNTNYNPEAEARAGRSGMATLARFLGAELSNLVRNDNGRRRSGSS
jgi:hypothetical protein